MPAHFPQRSFPLSSSFSDFDRAYPCPKSIPHNAGDPLEGSLCHNRGSQRCDDSRRWELSLSHVDGNHIPCCSKPYLKVIRASSFWVRVCALARAFSVPVKLWIVGARNSAVAERVYGCVMVVEPGPVTHCDCPRPTISTPKVDSGPSPRRLNSRSISCVTVNPSSPLPISESDRSNTSTQGPHFPNGPAIRYLFLILIGGNGSASGTGSAQHRQLWSSPGYPPDGGLSHEKTSPSGLACSDQTLSSRLVRQMYREVIRSCLTDQRIGVPFLRYSEKAFL